MKLLRQFVVLFSLTAGFFAKTVTKSQLRSSNWAALDRYINDQKTYNKVRDDVKGATKNTLETCREVFKEERWNCNVSDTKLLVRNGKQITAFSRNILPDWLNMLTNSSGPIRKRSKRQNQGNHTITFDSHLKTALSVKTTKEGAYIQALGSAKVMYTLTKNCRLGHYNDCACVPIDRPNAPDQMWRWYGCNENLKFGEDATKHFVDTLERKTNRRGALNLHNNEVGRKVVRIAARKKCKCIGPTASCLLKTCSRQLLDFREVGKLLKEKYDTAVRVKYANNTIKLFYDTGAVLPRGRQGSLAYVNKSPNYCLPDNRTGFPGMQKRKCLHGNDGAQKCDRMCSLCGRQPKHEVVLERGKCQCKIVGCCYIKCESCVKQLNVTMCS